VTAHQRLIREMILLMKTGRLDVTYFQEKFGVNILQEFIDGSQAWWPRAGRASTTTRSS